jgi:arylsulfatase
MTTAIEALKTRDRTKPIFLNISFARPHSPYVPPKHYFDYYYNKELPEAACGDWAEVHDNLKDAKSTEAWRGKMTEEIIHKARAGYYGEVSFIDTQIGRLMNWMKKYDGQEYANTCFIFTSDHGDMLGDHNLWRKTYAYQGSTKIPMIVMLPRSFNQDVEGTVEEVVELRDVMPTVLNVAGTEIPEIDGESLQPLIKGEPVKWRAYIHGEHCQCYSYEQEMHYVTNGKFKFVWLPKVGVEQFFDLTKDSTECCNLIADQDYEAEIKKWRGYLVDELAARDDGLTDNGRLIKQEKSYEPISPYRDVRY